LIGYIEGKILRKEEDRLLVLANQIGYEILVPAVVSTSLRNKHVGEHISLYIFHQQTERQPKPVLIGFNLEVEREFFQLFISVEDIGPLKAVKALSMPVREIASAIEARDVNRLSQLKGIGKRTAHKIVASLSGKMGKFALILPQEAATAASAEDLAKEVQEVMVNQLGHRAGDARRMIAEALERNREIATAEELFEEVYRGQINS
jgi:Holliday junction DNA helicase RuvA